MLPNWKESIGAVSEYEYAKAHKNLLGETIQIFYATEGVPLPEGCNLRV